MENGLTLSCEQFESLPSKDKLTCLFKNQVETMKLIKGYKFYYKITTVIGSFLVLGMGILFSFHLGD